MTEPLLPPSVDHVDRRPMVDELHARPFAPLHAPALIAYIALATEPGQRKAADAHLDALLTALHIADRPAAHENHRIWNTDQFRLRWERHAEFASFSVTINAAPATPFDVSALDMFPKLWLEAAPGGVLAAVLTQVEMAEDDDEAERMLQERFLESFVAESLAGAWIAGRQAIAAADFHVDPNGFTRVAVIGVTGVGPRRLGRLTQRLMELETYRALSMRTLPMARSLSPQLAEIDRSIADVVSAIGAQADGADGAEPQRASARERSMLAALTGASAKLERVAAHSAFRFSATRAYEAIVNERLEIIREERLLGRQTFSEFMVRRFKPAMRTIRSVEERLSALAARAERAANLLRTRVDVSLEAQNQDLLKSMNRRAELQLRLQQTVEGLSVVAISYYAVSLAGYVLAPLSALIGLSVKTLMALVALPIIGGVFLFVRSLRRRMEKR